MDEFISLRFVLFHYIVLYFYPKMANYLHKLKLP